MGFNPVDFIWSSETIIPRLEHKSNNYFIEYHITDNIFSNDIKYSPSSNQIVETSSSKLKQFKSWEDYLSETKNWLTNLTRELNSENYWEKIEYEQTQIIEQFKVHLIILHLLKKKL